MLFKCVIKTFFMGIFCINYSEMYSVHDDIMNIFHFKIPFYKIRNFQTENI